MDHRADQVMKKRKQPVMTFNRVARKIDGVVGLIEKLRQDPKATPAPPSMRGRRACHRGAALCAGRAGMEGQSPLVAQDGAVDGIGGIEIESSRATRATPSRA
jgi:hypothetical protein